MKWSSARYDSFSTNYRKTARGEGYIATVVYNGTHNYFYFMVQMNEYSYNSLWNNKKYATEEECCNECEKFCENYETMKS